MNEPVLAWHWLPEMGQLGNGDPRPVVPGETLVHEGPLVICEIGLHASVRAFDALQYARGSVIQRVECYELGDTNGYTDKIVCRRRKCLWMADATETLRAFARLCALSVINKWDAPQVVRDYLETGDETFRAAARDAAREATWVAAWDDAYAASGATWGTASDAARDAQNAKLEEMLMDLAPEGMR